MCCWQEGSLFLTSSQGYVPSTWLTDADVGLDHLVEFRLSVFSTVKCCPLWKEVPVCNPRWWSWEPASSWGQSSCINYLEFFCRRNLFFPTLLNLFISDGCMDIYSFTLGYHPIQVCLFCLLKLESFWPWGDSFSWRLLFPLAFPHHWELLPLMLLLLLLFHRISLKKWALHPWC